MSFHWVGSSFQTHPCSLLLGKPPYPLSARRDLLEKEMTKAVLHKRLPANEPGRDFIVADLHGCLDLFLTELERVQFDPQVDRMLCVGDLADRGPDSLGCLRLLREPWFYAVRGNHEQMLLDHLFPVAMPYASNDASERFFLNGGRWVETLTKQENLELLNDLIPRIARLPLVITVGAGEEQFHIVHAELMSGSPGLSDASLRHIASGSARPKNHILTDADVTEERLSTTKEALIWGRRVIGASKPERANIVDTSAGRLLVSRKAWHPGLSLTYAGHTIVKSMRLHASHLFIDRGAFKRERRTGLQMLCHQEVRTCLPKK